MFSKLAEYLLVYSVLNITAAFVVLRVLRLEMAKWQFTLV